jgi:hypothetical protein
VKGWKKSLQENGRHSIPDFIAISVQVHLKLKIVRRDNEHHFILIKEMLPNIHATSISAPIYNEKRILT